MELMCKVDEVSNQNVDKSEKFNNSEKYFMPNETVTTCFNDKTSK